MLQSRRAQPGLFCCRLELNAWSTAWLPACGQAALPCRAQRTEAQVQSASAHHRLLPCTCSVTHAVLYCSFVLCAATQSGALAEMCLRPISLWHVSCASRQTTCTTMP